MAYQTHATSNTSLITGLSSHSIITSPLVKTAMLAVDRGDFLPEHVLGDGGRQVAYDDSPQGIGWGATISAPHMHAMALEWLGGSEGIGKWDEREGGWLRGKRVLDVGSGSGYLTACLVEMVLDPSDSDSGKGKVVGIEHIKELRDMGYTNFCKREMGRKLIEEGKVEFVVGDGREGWIGDGEGYDAIHVGAAAVTVHDALIDQLRSPGRIFIPVQDPKKSNQYIWVIDKDIHGTVSRRKLCGVNYVPLTDAPGRT